jgi:acetylornithine deacetylase/succinyl-diaminopimelate desuccinylase-like protein
LPKKFWKAQALQSRFLKLQVTQLFGGRIENDPNGPTVAIYNHIDVQPAEKGKNGWTRDPFTFVEENGRYYSRGTTDDKGPAMTAFWGARMAKELGVKTNIEFIWELEEEIGSPNFHEAVEQIKKVTKAQSIIVSDTIWLDSEQPAMTKSLRGLVAFLLKLKTSEKDVHSGLCGGSARNPITEICDIVSKCVDAKLVKSKFQDLIKHGQNHQQNLSNSL